MEIYQCIPSAAIRGSEDSIAGPGWHPAPEVTRKGVSHGGYEKETG